MLNNLRHWLIKKLAGTDAIVLNCTIEGTIKGKPGIIGYIANNLILPEKGQPIIKGFFLKEGKNDSPHKTS